MLKINLQVDSMKIVSIFAENLFALHYEGEAENEYERLLNLWNDPEYVYDFLKSNRLDFPTTTNIEIIAKDIFIDADYIDKTLIKITQSTTESLSYFFRPLRNSEYQFKILSLQKGRKNYLRLYAIKIDNNTFVITGGAIKLPLHHLMEEREHTLAELSKLKRVKQYLDENGVFDDDSFFEFFTEQFL